MPQFSDRKWLIVGVASCAVVIFYTWTPILAGKIFITGVSLGLAVHCIHMMKYWKAHIAIRRRSGNERI